jgi:predicted dehydrogenase
VTAYNQRAVSPTAWQLEVHTGPDYMDRLLREKPGNVVVLSGRNAGKVERVGASVKGGLHALVDKPWILRSSDLPALAAVLDEADRKGVVAYDIMTERFEVTTELQRALVGDQATFGTPIAGTPEDPGVYIESVHHLMKVVSGAPNIRPTWFFDTAEQGEGLNDIGTHLVDLVQWTLFPGQAIDYRADVKVLDAYRWPTMIGEADFRRVTGTGGFPAALTPQVKNGQLEYFCNTFATYTVRGIHTALNVIWDWEAPAGSGDTHFAVYRGTRARIEARQSKVDKYRPEVYVVPNAAADKAAVLAAVKAKLAALATTYPGVGVEDRGTDLHLTIPDSFRVGHEAHFAQVTANFLGYLRQRSTLPAWERPNMLAKYFVTTTGTELSRTRPVKVAPRRAP